MPQTSERLRATHWFNDNGVFEFPRFARWLHRRVAFPLTKRETPMPVRSLVIAIGLVVVTATRVRR